MSLARSVHDLRNHETPKTVLSTNVPAVKMDTKPTKVLGISVGNAELQQLKKEWTEKDQELPWVCLKTFKTHVLQELRDELVHELKGLQPIETQHTMVLAMPFEMISAECPALEVLRESLAGDELRHLIEEITSSALPKSKPRCSLVAVPPGGHVLPQSFGGTPGSLGFTLFLVEDWWAESDGGILELFGDEGSATARILPRASELVLYRAKACAITRVLSDEAPQLAVHAIYPGEEDAWVPRAIFDQPFLTCDLNPRSHSKFNSDDHATLEALVSSKYLETSQLDSLCCKFEDDSKLILPGFLHSDIATEISAALGRTDARGSVGAIGGGWRLVGPVLHRRCCDFRVRKSLKGRRFRHLRRLGRQLKATSPAGRALAQIAKKLTSPAFVRYIERLTGLRGLGCLAGWIRRFRPGLDYERPTCATKAQLDVVLSFETSLATVNTSLRPSRRSRWKDLGGAVLYSEKDAGQRTAEAAGLLAGPDGVPCAAPVFLRLPLRNNCLHLVLRDPETSQSIEVSKSSRWEIRFALPVDSVDVDLTDMAEGSPSQDVLKRRKRRRTPKASEKKRSRNFW